MAESVKLKDNRYIDTDGIYDAELKKTQKKINKELEQEYIVDGVALGEKFTGNVTVRVIGKMCYVELYEIKAKSVPLQGTVLVSGLPKSKIYSAQPTNNGAMGSIYVDAGDTILYTHQSSTTNFYQCFMYPIE